MKEVLALEPAARLWDHLWANRLVTVYSDNTAAVFEAIFEHCPHAQGVRLTEPFGQLLPVIPDIEGDPEDFGGSSDMQVAHHIMSPLFDTAGSGHQACLLMFFGLLRRSNVLPPSGGVFDPLRHLRRSDVSFTSDGARLLFRWSKTDHFGSRPRVIPYPRIRGHPLCPTQALFHALRLTPAALPDGPLFVTRSAPQAPALSPAMFSKVFLSALRRSSADTTGLASHSFRRGGAVFLWSSAVWTRGESGSWGTGPPQRIQLTSSVI